MRRLLLLCVLTTASTGQVARTQSLDAFDAWMQTIDEKNQSVQQHIARKDANGVMADATVLQDSFARVEAFFLHRDNSADAAELAKEARERAGRIVTAVEDKDFERASGESIKVAATCTPCHRLYRPLP